MNLLKRASAFAFVATAFAAACGPSDDNTDASTDAQSDQSITDATKDAPSTDAAKDVTVTDSASDSASDSAADSGSDSASDSAADAPKDAPLEVSTVDAGGCKTNSDCLSTEYCLKAIGDCSGTGTCTAKPTGLCSNACKYFCGCDKVTYCNSCYSGKAGTSENYSGVCE